MIVRRATAADDAVVIEMLGELQQAQAPAERHRWLYVDNPAGRALTWLAVEEETGAVAGVTSFFPYRMVVNGVERLGALGGDGWVRPAFRRRGIGGQLHAASRAEMPAEKIVCMYGAPGAMNVTPLQAGGSKRVGEVVRWLRPRALRFVPSRAELEPVRGEDPRIDRLWAETARELPIAAVRDARFYDWRFVRSPSQRQRAHLIVKGRDVLGACALEVIDGRWWVTDLLAPAARWTACLGAIARTAAADVVIRLADADGGRRALWRAGFLRRDGKPFLVMVPPDGATDALPVLLDPRKWFYTGADSDLDTSQ